MSATGEGLGAIFNVLTTANDTYISMKDCGSVAFVCLNTGGDTWTLTEATDASGTGAVALATITTSHVSATVGAAWTRLTQAAASTEVSSSSQDVCVIQVSDYELSDGFDFVKIAATGSGTVVAITYDLKVQRKAVNQPAMV